MQKKVGFLAFLGTNYGTVLQSFALYQAICRLGYECEIIGCNEFRGREYPAPILKETDPKQYDKQLMQKNFECFIDKWFKFNEVLGNIPANAILADEQKKELNVFDAFVCGSDQIWKPKGFWFCAKRYLQFAPEEKRIGYAPSVGWNKIPADVAKNIPQWNSWLSTVRYLSTRETTGSALVAKATGRSVATVLDPTFLLKPEEWKEFLNERKFSNEIEKILDSGKPYMVAYLLDTYDRYQEYVRKLAQRLNVEIIWLTGRDNVGPVQRNCAETDPPGFVSLIRNAAFVCCDGFHGTCFSLNHSRPFAVLSKGDATGNDSRMQDLMRRVGISGRIVNPGDDPEKLDIEIDYDTVQKNISIEREKSLTYLSSALEGACYARGMLYDSIEKEMAKIRNTTTSITDVIDIAHNCTGCGACVSCCPTGALELKADQYGYYRAFLKNEKCIKCKKCISVCPVFELPEKKNSKEPTLYMFQAANEDLLYSSTSGAVFPLLARQVIAQNGCVVGAAWTNDFRCEHIIVENINEISKLSKSKYLQSYVGDIGKHIKERLDKGQKVLFSGCPCQVAGLLKFVGEENKNLLTVDILCAYAPSAFFFKKYIDEDFGERLKQYTFRDKRRGWDCYSICATVDGSGDIFRRGGKEDAYQRVFHDHTMISNHCETCCFQNIPRFGDLTIGDFWGISQREPLLDSRKGISAVLCNNEKGKDFFESIPQNEIAIKEEKPLEWLGGNGFAVKGKNFKSQYRDKFYEYILNNSFSKTLQLMKYDDKETSPFHDKRNVLDCEFKQTYFLYENEFWEEAVFPDRVLLHAKLTNSPRGHFACLPFAKQLIVGKSYRLMIRFMAKTDSKLINFHVADISNPKRLQIVASHKVNETNKEKWIDIDAVFTCNREGFNAFSVGAAQFIGKDRYILFKYVGVIVA